MGTMLFFLQTWRITAFPAEKEYKNPSSFRFSSTWLIHGSTHDVDVLSPNTLPNHWLFPTGKMARSTESRPSSRNRRRLFDSRAYPSSTARERRRGRRRREPGKLTTISDFDLRTVSSYTESLETDDRSSKIPKTHFGPTRYQKAPISSEPRFLSPASIHRSSFCRPDRLILGLSWFSGSEVATKVFSTSEGSENVLVFSDF